MVQLVNKDSSKMNIGWSFLCIKEKVKSKAMELYAKIYSFFKATRNFIELDNFWIQEYFLNFLYY